MKWVLFVVLYYGSCFFCLFAPRSSFALPITFCFANASMDSAYFVEFPFHLAPKLHYQTYHVGMGVRRGRRGGLFTLDFEIFIRIILFFKFLL